MTDRQWLHHLHAGTELSLALPRCPNQNLEQSFSYGKKEDLGKEKGPGKTLNICKFMKLHLTTISPSGHQMLSVLKGLRNNIAVKAGYIFLISILKVLLNKVTLKKWFKMQSCKIISAQFM